MKFSTVLSGHELKKELDFVRQRLVDINQSIVSKCCLLSRDQTYLISKLQTMASLNWHNETEQLLYHIIIDHCLKSEKAGPGSFFIALKMITDSLGDNKIININEAISNVLSRSKVTIVQELRVYINTILDDEFLTDLVFEIFAISGLESRIVFEETESETLSIEFQNGFNFNVNLPLKSKSQFKNVLCCIIDGHIESVSEIHKILETLSRQKEPLVLITRGFDPEVLNTLKVNNDRGTLNVIPVIVPFDFVGMNLLGDICLVAGSEMISSSKGQLISSIGVENLVRVPSISCSEQVMVIMNDKAVGRAQVQVQFLRTKRNQASLEEISGIYDKRIQSLSPGIVKVRIPPSHGFTEYSEKLDRVFRTIKSVIKFGLFSKHETDNEALAGLPGEVPIESLIASLRFSDSCVIV